MLPISTSTESIDPHAIAAFIRGCADNEVELHSVIITRHGRVVTRAFAEPWAQDNLQLVYSCSKTFTSAAVGIAAAEGKFSYDDLIVDLFPDQVDDRVGPKARTITVNDCLHMASGHTQEMLDKIAATRGGLSRDCIGEFLRHEPEGTPGVTFQYSQPNTWILSTLVSQTMGMTVHELLQERLWKPLGIERSFWSPDLDGNSWGFSGLHIQPDDLASFFQLLHDKGVRDGVQLLPTEWIERYARDYVSTEAWDNPNSRLGYAWQVWKSKVGHRADGAYGQFGQIMPEHDMVVTVTSGTEPMMNCLDSLWENLLPGIDREPADAAAAQADLDQAIAEMALRPEVGAWSDQTWKGTGPDGATLILGPVDGSAWSLTWHEQDAGNTIKIGQDNWCKSVMRWGDTSLQVAAIGGWNGDHFTFRLACLNTPHTAELTLTEGGEASLAWVTTPLGPTLPRGLAQPFRN